MSWSGDENGPPDVSHLVGKTIVEADVRLVHGDPYPEDGAPDSAYDGFNPGSYAVLILKLDDGTSAELRTRDASQYQSYFVLRSDA